MSLVQRHGPTYTVITPQGVTAYTIGVDGTAPECARLAHLHARQETTP